MAKTDFQSFKDSKDVLKIDLSDNMYMKITIGNIIYL